MIEYLRGRVISKTPTTTILEVNNIGYNLSISLNTFSQISEGGEAVLYCHEVIREDVYDLYGFAQESERRLFRLLITVNGVGPNSARIMLSSFSPQDLAQRIAAGNEDTLQSVKGIGAKTAQRIIVELKKKVSQEMADILGDGTLSVEGTGEGASPSSVEVAKVGEDTIRALVVLGYPEAAARKVVARLVKSNPELSVNDMVRMSLRMF